MNHSARSLRFAAGAVAAAAALTCQDVTPPETPPSPASSVSVSYVCGRDFDIENANESHVTVRFEVAGTGEAGELSLAGRPDTAPASQTRLTTLTTGAVQLSVDGEGAGGADNAGTTCPTSSPAPSKPQASAGEWSPPFPWPVVAVHLHLLPDGRVLSWGAEGDPQIWDPSTGAFSAAPAGENIFCAGHAFLPDGRLLVAGGQLSEAHGLPGTNVFDYATGTWSAATSMAQGRWYPTATELADGRVLIMAGTDEHGLDAPVPEIWSAGTWTPLPAAERVLPYYPRNFVAPGGRVFYAGESRQSGYLDPATWAWIGAAPSLYGNREYGSAVMYRPGKVLIVGGSDVPDGAPTATAETIDLAQSSPAWHFTGPMAFARRQLNATLLPDGRVAVTGGTSSPGFTDPAGAVHAVEAWDPATGVWDRWASNVVTRVYHSTTILLPDGRLLHAGSGDGGNLPRELNAELFSPPYLFRGARPSIGAAPDVVRYGEAFEVSTEDAGTVVAASLVRLSSVTHAFDQNQRFVPLSLRRSAGGVTIVAPTGPDLAPPGHYMLFLLNGSGVPSMARFMRVE